MPNNYGSNANAAMPNSDGNGNDDGNVKPAHRFFLFLENNNVKQDFFCVAVVYHCFSFA